LETVERDYSDKGVGFYYIYKALAHPEWNGYVTPFTLQERLMQVAEAERTLGTRFTWLCDSMDNAFKNAMGRAPNSEWVIDENNVIVRRRDWSDPAALRKDLEELVGPVEHPTQVADLDMPTAPPPKAAASDVVPRIDKPGRMIPLKISPALADSPEPFYAKLRVEAERGVLQDGSGTLYLRFMMDPLYHVHWNNLVDPVQVKIEAPEGVTVTPNTLIGPKVDAAEGDIDPREFLVQVTGATDDTKLLVKAHYFACTDDWCRAMDNQYVVNLVGDRDGGFVINPSFRKRMQQMMRNRGNRRGNRPGAKGGGRPGAAPRGPLSKAVGQWQMATQLGDNAIDAVMSLRVQDGRLVGTWESQGMSMDLENLTLDGDQLSFTRRVQDMVLTFKGHIGGNAIKGIYTGPFGELKSTGTRAGNAAGDTDKKGGSG